MAKSTSRPFSKWTEHTVNHSIKAYIEKFEGKLIYTEGWLPKNQRKGGVFLMEELYDKYKTDKRLISQLNRCRMSVQAITLADITDANGRFLIMDQLEGKRSQERKSKVEWPTVGNIRKKYWKKWKNCVRET